MKGQGLSMSMVVTAALAVIVLLLVGVFFSGGFRAMGEKVQDFTESSAGNSTAKGLSIDCNNACSLICVGQTIPTWADDTCDTRAECGCPA